MKSYRNATGSMISRINTSEDREYCTIAGYRSRGLMIIDMVNEPFLKVGEFIEMLWEHRGRYDPKKIFMDGKGGYSTYGLMTLLASVSFCLCHKVKKGKVVAVNSLFATQAFTYKSIRGMIE